MVIYAVPIREAYERDGGCPLCFLRARVERDSLEYVMGAAMMEPDVRRETNRRGFCAAHMKDMLAMRNRLSLALMLESLLGRTLQAGADAPALPGGCYVCRRIETFMGHFAENIALMWRDEPAFRALAAGRGLCPRHTGAVLDAAGGLPRRERAAFARAMTAPMLARAGLLRGQVEAFCQSFDHRRAGSPPPEGSAAAVERAAAFVGGYDIF